MAVTCQDVFNRALALNVANAGFVTLPAPEILARLNEAQAKLTARLAQDNRLYYMAHVAVPSTGGGAGRSIDLTQVAFAPPVERVVIIFLPDGSTEVSLVDIQDLDAELAPRAYAEGNKIIEVGSEWSATVGVVNLIVYYVTRQAAFNLAGLLTQTLTIPDQFATYFDYELALYFNGKDIGRASAAPSEIQELTGKQEAVYQSFLQFLDHLHGTMQRRFALPVPTRDEKQ